MCGPALEYQKIRTTRITVVPVPYSWQYVRPSSFILMPGNIYIGKKGGISKIKWPATAPDVLQCDALRCYTMPGQIRGGLMVPQYAECAR